MEITRNYTHRTHGEIGTATLVAPDGKWTLDGKELPESSVAHLVNFALQSLQDAYAGADDNAEAVGAFNTKRDKLIAGTLGTRGSGGATDPRVLVARSVTRSAIKAKLGSDSAKWKAFIALPDADQLAKLDEQYAANESVLSPLVDQKLAEREAAAKAKKAASKAVSFDL